MQVEAGSLHEHRSDFLRLWKCLDCVRHVAGWKYHQGTVMLDSILICTFFFVVRVDVSFADHGRA